MRLYCIFYTKMFKNKNNVPFLVPHFSSLKLSKYSAHLQATFSLWLTQYFFGHNLYDDHNYDNHSN